MRKVFNTAANAVKNAMANKQNSRIIERAMSSTKAISKRLTDDERLLRTSIGNRALPNNWMKGGHRATGMANMAHNAVATGRGVGKGINAVLNNSIVNRSVNAGAVLLGAAGMASISVMNGGLQKMDEVMQQRYMRDSRYSSRMLAQSNVGRSSGNGRLSIGNHTGLSLSMHKGRHG